MCTIEELFGYVEGDRFIIHKNPEHLYKIYGGFGINEKRLTDLLKKGIKDVFILYHVNEDETILYKTTVLKWLIGKRIINKKSRFGEAEPQLIIALSELRGFK